MLRASPECVVACALTPGASLARQALVCERNVAQQCGRLPVTDAFVYNPAEAEAVDAALLCSDACRAAVESALSLSL